MYGIEGLYYVGGTRSKQLGAVDLKLYCSYGFLHVCQKNLCINL